MIAKSLIMALLVLGSGCAHLRPPERDASHDYATMPRPELGEPGTNDNPDKRFGLFGSLYHFFFGDRSNRGE